MSTAAERPEWTARMGPKLAVMPAGRLVARVRVVRPSKPLFVMMFVGEGADDETGLKRRTPMTG
jgi:hypothetical protein